jgi:hypothetical protein
MELDFFSTQAKESERANDLRYLEACGSFKLIEELKPSRFN